MKTIRPFLFILLLTFSGNSIAQTAEELYEQSLKALNNKEYEKAISIMDAFISKYPDFKNVHMIYLNRASAKSLVKDYEGAISDYNTAYAKDTAYAEAVRQRGYTRKLMGQPDAALADYNLALRINPRLATAYVNKAAVLKELGRTDEACRNYEKALELGITDAAGMIYKSCDSLSPALLKYTYRILVDKTADKTYGYTVENPVKTGYGPKGQRAYLDLLRDEQGNKPEYVRTGNAGFYESENGMMGLAAIDTYEITYKNSKGKKKKTVLYISFYDYEQPKIPVGFFSVNDFKTRQGTGLKQND
jgi:tetratricopeptide (TPR) repeat protein